MTIAWVIGSTGLLGSALIRTLRSRAIELFVPDQPLRWDNEAILSTQFSAAVQAFSNRLAGHQRWEIYWAAGIGTMSSSADSLAPETRALSLVLQLVKSDSRINGMTSAIAFASSAGAIYANSADEVITENSAVTLSTPYAKEKLTQENLVRDFVTANKSCSALIARISTLYGAGQAVGKKQGLIGNIARSVLRNQPIQIYVPYDTIRDYIDVDDAADAMVDATSGSKEAGRSHTKIIAAECPVTIAQIISIFKRVSRRPPRIIRGANRLSNLYSRRVQFKSVVLLDHPRKPPKQLSVGIGLLMASERTALCRTRNTNEPVTDLVSIELSQDKRNE